MTVSDLAKLLNLPAIDRLMAFEIHANAPSSSPVIVHCHYLAAPISVDEQGRPITQGVRYQIKSEFVE